MNPSTFRVLLDADGVLVDFLTPLLACVERVTGVCMAQPVSRDPGIYAGTFGGRLDDAMDRAGI